MNKSLSLAVVGTGVIGQDHLNEIPNIEGIHVVAVADIDFDKAKTTAAKYNIKPYATIDALLQDSEVEGVLICTPHNLHAGQAIMAAEAGKHVFVEKPMALTLADCDRMIDACNKANVILMIGQLMRYHPANRKVKEMLSEKIIGDIGHIVARHYLFFDPTQPENPYQSWYLDQTVGGLCVLHTLGPHGFDLLHWFIDSPIVKVYAQGSESTSLYGGQKDSYSAILNHNCGAVSVLTQSMVNYSGVEDTHFVGSTGSLMLQNRKVFLNGELLDLNIPGGMSMKNQIREFADCCLNGTVPDANGISVRHTMEVIEAIRLSSERHEPVWVSEINEGR